MNGQLCTFYLDELICGIDVSYIQEVVPNRDATKIPLSADCVEGLINLRGQIVTAIDLRSCLELTPRPAALMPVNLIIRRDTELVSFLVDKMGDVQEVGEETFEMAPETLPAKVVELVKGAHKLPGYLLLVLDAAQIIEQVASLHHLDPPHE